MRGQITITSIGDVLPVITEGYLKSFPRILDRGIGEGRWKGFGRAVEVIGMGFGNRKEVRK